MINYFELMRVLDGTPLKNHVVLSSRLEPMLTLVVDQMMSIMEDVQRGLSEFDVLIRGCRYYPSTGKSRYRLVWLVKPNELEPENKFELVLS